MCFVHGWTVIWYLSSWLCMGCESLIDIRSTTLSRKLIAFDSSSTSIGLTLAYGELQCAARNVPTFFARVLSLTLFHREEGGVSGSSFGKGRYLELFGRHWVFGSGNRDVRLNETVWFVAVEGLGIDAEERLEGERVGGSMHPFDTLPFVIIIRLLVCGETAHGTMEIAHCSG